MILILLVGALIIWAFALWSFSSTLNVSYNPLLFWSTLSTSFSQGLSVGQVVPALLMLVLIVATPLLIWNLLGSGQPATRLPPMGCASSRSASLSATPGRASAACGRLMMTAMSRSMSYLSAVTTPRRSATRCCAFCIARPMVGKGCRSMLGSRAATSYWQPFASISALHPLHSPRRLRRSKPELTSRHRYGCSLHDNQAMAGLYVGPSHNEHVARKERRRSPSQGPPTTGWAMASVKRLWQKIAFVPFPSVAQGRSGGICGCLSMARIF
jgi:hypothetical protein